MLDKNILLVRSKIKKYMASKYDSDFTVSYIRKNCYKDYMKKRKVARLLLDNIFLFNDSWDMEACHVPYQNKKLDWNYIPNGDGEWAYMINRQEYLYTLMLSYYIEGDMKYIDKLKELIFSWIDNNDLYDESSMGNRTIDTGIRCNSWTEILRHLIYLDLLDDIELKKIVKSMESQLIYLKNNYKEKYVLSNWGVLQTYAILNAYIWFEDLFENKDVYYFAKSEFEKQIEIQIFDDGSHWEQSPMYHVEVLKCIHIYAHSSMANDRDVEKFFVDAIDKMTDYIAYSMSPIKCFDAQGDSDRTNVKDILEKGCVLTENAFYKSLVDKELSISTIYMIGKFAYDKFSSIVAKDSKVVSKSYVDSGNIYIRNNFSDKGDFTVVKNGTLGSGHGHCDLGHVSLYSGGNPFLVDSGRYTYLEDDRLREYLKSAQAHNVCVIDESPAAKAKGSWDYEYHSDCLKNYYKNKDGIDYCEVPYITKVDNKLAVVTRKVLYIQVGIWIIITEVRCDGNHTAKTYYNFDSDVEIKKIFETKIEAKNISTLDFYFDNCDSLNIESSIISKVYNQLSNNKKLVCNKAFTDKLVTCDTILKRNRFISSGIDVKLRSCDSNKIIDDGRYLAKKFDISDEESYIVISFNKETYSGRKLYYYNHVPVYGKFVVIHKVKDIYKNIILRS